jgi:hypothetical protein
MDGTTKGPFWMTTPQYKCPDSYVRQFPRLFSNAQPVNNLAISIAVLPLKVIEKAASLPYQL